MKIGTKDISPGLNPKLGRRVAIAHSMGLNFPSVGIKDIKLFAAPMWHDANGWHRADDIRITLEGYDQLPD